MSETHYLQNVVGDTQIRKGEGMEFDQLLEKTAYMRERNANIHPIDFGILSEAFRIKETTPVHLPSVRHLIHMCLFVLLDLCFWVGGGLAGPGLLGAVSYVI